MQIIEKQRPCDYFLELIERGLADGKMNKSKMEAIINRFRSSIGKEPIFLDRHRLKLLNNVIGFHITRAALSVGLCRMSSLREIALISGAGIAGLAASFELLAKGFKVVIVEKREAFSRFNVINLSLETQIFLKKFKLLDEFEASVAARIKEHRCTVIGKENLRRLPLSDVSQLQLDKFISFEPENFSKLFHQDGVYSVQIGILQNFLAKKALEAGAHLFGKVAVEVLERRKEGGVSRVAIRGEKSLSQPMILQPGLFFIAEGAHSATADQLGMETRVIENECAGENWIFGNITYPGKENFVVSIIDASKNNLQIANVIFNAKSHVINIAVTSKSVLDEARIREQILEVARLTFHLENIDGELQLLNAVQQPVSITNQIAVDFSIDNVFRIGDAAGNSSPLAGLGGTLGLTLVPRTIEQLLDDYKLQPKNMHHNFKRFSEGYVSRWNEKSCEIKKFCLKTSGLDENG